ncbi:amidohydrolase [Vibrio sp. vnigr-6D03]|uniref:M20 aminoacylase family protein n=1 Tax=Vibrio sp. vnigr-6D03 TaxID=2058088 RepID=UPI000C33B50C|nr:M20 aminoacylase family protein [Vibrio sp. vnigr-6D03]PKF78947.1 amidohydrolase [Vibrio sp. vnigr-6D03]
MKSELPIGEDLQQDMQAWRRDIHAHPETAYEEHRTSEKVAALLESFGLEVHRGLAGTGVVATVKGKLASSQANDSGVNESKAIGLRADMDALNLTELNDVDYCSKHKGKMHACGHDGHTAMLLGAAKYLSENRDFAGTVVLIFQPAEEGEAGGRAMVEQGLFEQFPVDAVYGMHNWPGLEKGKFAVHNGAVMASMDLFDISITGKGCHAAMPHLGVDPVVIAGQLISSLQSIVGRTLSSLESGVVSITKMQGGEAYNVIPDSVTLSGTCRAFSPEVQELLESRIRTQVHHICEAYGANGEVDYRRMYPPTINVPEYAERCSKVAESLVGAENVKHCMAPSMGAEDFAFMLQEKPGAYIWVGNGVGEESAELHNPHYDFNDDILSLGASYWVELVHAQLKPE